MARKQNNDDLLIEDELTAAFLSEDDAVATDDSAVMPVDDQGWNDSEEEFPGQLAVDVCETEDQLVVKSRTAGVNREDLDVSISDGILTISGTFNSGDDSAVTKWHMQECYWGEFSRTLALPVAVKEESGNAALKEGILTVVFDKVKQEQAKKIAIQ